MKVAAAQTHPSFADPEQNRKIIHKYCEKAARKNIELLVFPELCVTGYNFSSHSVLNPLAEEVPDGPTTQVWIEQAKTYQMIIVGGLAERGEDEKLYNSAVIVDPEGFVGCYRKIHLFGCEPDFFAPGNEPPKVFKLPKVSVGVLVCFDWIFPEAARILMLERCEVLCIPANLVLPYAQRVMIARSIENRFYTILTNRIGTEKDLTFTGQSQITNVNGDVLARGPTRRTTLVVADADPFESQNKQITPYNNIIRDRRIDLYQRLLQA